MDERQVQYGVAEHASTGDVWAVKAIGLTVCGVRKFKQRDAPTKAQLPTLTYEVGAELEFFRSRLQEFTIYPWLKD